MKGRRQVQQDSAAQYMLEHLFNTGSVYHKELMLIFGNSRNKQAAWRVLNELETNGLVVIKKGTNKDIRKIHLSNTGLSMLQNIDDYYKLYEHLKVSHWNIKDEKAEKEAQIKTMMVATDILCYPRHKPDLTTTAKIINTKNVPDDSEIVSGYWYSESIQNFGLKFGQGIFYSPAEVRDALRPDIGAEQIYRSRFNGIVVTPDKLYILYHVQDGLMKIDKPSERVLIESLQTLFVNYTPYTKHGKPSSIVFGTAPVKLAIPTLVMGFKDGIIKNPKSLRNIEAQESLNFLKANVNLFGEMFYIPISEAGIPLLEDIVATTKEERKTEALKWFNTTTGYTVQDFDIPIAFAEDKECIVEFVTYIELKKILDIRKKANPCRIVTLPVLAEGISQAVGPNAIDFVDKKNREIATGKYTIYGYKDGEEEKNKEEEKDDSGEKEEVSKSVHFRIPVKMYELLDKDAEKENISVQQKIKMIIEKYYS